MHTCTHLCTRWTFEPLVSCVGSCFVCFHLLFKRVHDRTHSFSFFFFSCVCVLLLLAWGLIPATAHACSAAQVASCVCCWHSQKQDPRCTTLFFVYFFLPKYSCVYFQSVLGGSRTVKGSERERERERESVCVCVCAKGCFCTQNDRRTVQPCVHHACWFQLKQHTRGEERTRARM